MVVVNPGVAIDASGREIIVPAPIQVDPWILTDGRVTRDLRETGFSHLMVTEEPSKQKYPINVAICLSYNECLKDYIPVAVSECNTKDQCAADTLVETYTVIVTEKIPNPILLDLDYCKALWADQKPAEEISGQNESTVITNEVQIEEMDLIRKSLCEEVSRPWVNPLLQSCIPIAVIPLLGDSNLGDPVTCEYRSLIYSNSQLLNMILCLSDRISECCGQKEVHVQKLEIRTGNNQTAPVGDVVEDLEVTVLRDGQPVTDVVPVTFEVAGNNGEISNDNNPFVDKFVNKLVVNTNAGIARLNFWKLGVAGTNFLSASIDEGSPADKMFFANGLVKPEAVKELIPILSTDGQTAVAGSHIQIQAQVIANGKPFNGAKVFFAVIEGKGEIGQDDQHIVTTYESDSINTTPTGASAPQDGIATLPYWKLGLAGTNRVQAYINVTGGIREYTYKATATTPSEPPQNNWFVIQAINFYTSSKKQIGTLKFPKKDPALEIKKEKLEYIQVVFNHDLDKTSIIMGEPDKSSLLIIDKNENDRAVRIKVDHINRNEIWVTLNDDAFKPNSIYVMTLFGGPTGNHSQIMDIDKNILDGDPLEKPDPITHVISGNGIPGGNFEFTFTISQ